MKFYLLAVTLLASATNAFILTSNTESTTCLAATSSRREALQKAAGLVAAGGGAAFVLGLEVAKAEPRPMYLTEPTAEFKANEQKAAEFKREQLTQKKKFNELLDKLTNEPDDADALENDLINLRRLVVETRGLPAGIKKEDMYKIIRTKKAGGFWPTKVEIA